MPLRQRRWPSPRRPLHARCNRHCKAGEAAAFCGR
jgi:hypothetical protein